MLYLTICVCHNYNIIMFIIINNILIYKILQHQLVN